MNAIVKKDQGRGFEYVEIETPVPKDNEVLIKVEAASICGTDIHFYEWDKMAIDFGEKYNVNFPFIVGHECAGIIVDVGKNVKQRKIGQRVAIETHIPCGECYSCQNENAHNCNNMQIFGTSSNGCFADYTVIDEEATFVLPDKVTFKEGALLEPAGVAMRAIEESKIVPGEYVIVNGCGAIGLFTVQILAKSGAICIATDKDNFKLQIAKKFGAITINVEEEDIADRICDILKTQGGVDVLIETSGSADVYSYIFDLIRNEGRLITVGHPKTVVEIDIMKNINLKGLSVKGIFGRRIWKTWWHLLSLILNNKISLLDIVTHQYSFEQFDEAFNQIQEGAGKILLVKGN